jgi:hypothetical protein
VKIKEVIIAIKTPLTLLLVLTGFIILLFFMFPTQEQAQEPKDQYFICCIEKMTSEFYTVVYMKNGESFYPHFTAERQVHNFIEHLEKLGTVDRNGYEVAE